MSLALLVSNHELLNDLYSLNLAIYVDTEVELVTTLEDALAELGGENDFDIIITLSNIEGDDCGLAIVEQLNKTASSVPIVMIGEKSSVAERPGVHTIPPNLNVKNLLRTVAKILGITAKDMAAKEMPEFYPIPVHLFSGMEKSPCDVFVRVSKDGAEDEYAQILQAGMSVGKKVELYRARGTKTVYVRSNDRLTFVNHSSGLILEKLQNEDMEVEEAISVAEQGYEIVANQITNDSEANTRISEISRLCIATISDSIRHVPKLKTLIAAMLDNKAGFLYMHTVLATFVSQHIIRNISWGSDEHIEKVQFVLFFHDLFLTPIYNKFPDFKYEEDLVFSDLLSEHEKEIVISHAKMAGEMVKKFPRAPMGADALLLQHHGMTNGEGFALEYKDDVSPLAKVIIVAEEFVTLLLKKKEEDGSFNTEEITQELKSKFTKHTYKKIIDALEGINL